MKTVTSTALANIKHNKVKNLLSGIAITLTTMLLFMVLTIGFGSMSLEFEAVNEIYPTWHMMYRNVNEDTVKALRNHGDIESLGERQDVGEIVSRDYHILLTYVDEKGYELNKLPLEKGTYPQNKEDIVVSQGLLDALNLKGTIGDYIELPYQILEKSSLSLEKKNSFKICGIIETSENNIKEKVYTGLVSKTFMEEQIPKEQRCYRVMFRIGNSKSMTTDHIETLGEKIASDFNIDEANVVKNTNYLMANYVDPAFYTGIGVIILIVVLAGILTIYSIYFVSMAHKVQEYGKLKAIGATKKQIRHIVLREGFFIALIAIPLGLLIGSLCTKGFFNFFVRSVKDTNSLSSMMINLLNEGKVSLFKPWIFIASSVTTLITVYFSLLKPMVTASKISPIEAIGYNGEIKSKMKFRNGYVNLSLLKLTKVNLGRNKKRTAITIATLGITGILFLVVATVISCADPKELAREDILFDYSISINSRSDDKMRPELSWNNIQQNNPLNNSFEKKVSSIDGVKEVKKFLRMNLTITELLYHGEPWISHLRGLDESFASILEKNQVDGNITYDELKEGKKILVSKNFLHWFPNTKVGDNITVTLHDGNNTFDKSFEIGAIGDYSHSITGGSEFILPASVLENLSTHNMIYSYEIAADSNKVSEVNKALESFVSGDERLELKSYDGYVKQWENTMDMTSKLCYAFMIVLGGIGIMNLINTMINSIYTRKRELGMMEAIGLSQKQMLHMLQVEGLFYTLSSLVMTLVLGSLIGYGVFLYAKTKGMLNITNYHYPLNQSLLLIAVVVILELVLTLIISKSFKKESLIDRIRFSE